MLMKNYFSIILNLRVQNSEKNFIFFISKFGEILLKLHEFYEKLKIINRKSSKFNRMSNII